MSKLDSLLKSNIGQYNKCEIIEILGFVKNKKPFNIYTLVIFENTKQKNINKFITEKPQKIEGSQHIKYGINQRIVNIDVVQKLFSELVTTNKFYIDDYLDVGELRLLPEQYIMPSNEIFDKIYLNYILKNNFNNGSYLLEFFDEDKSNINFLLKNQEALNNLSAKISNLLPLQLAEIPDRLGNIIFQFPINSLEIYFTTTKEENPSRYTGIQLEIKNKNGNFDIKNLIIRIYENTDNSITRQKLIEVKDSITHIELDDCFGTHIEIFDKNSSLLIYKNKFSIMKQINLNMGIVEPQRRVFEVNGKKEKVEVVHHRHSTHNIEEKKDCFQWILQRDSFKVTAANTKYSEHYYKQREKALQDIRELINKYGSNEVYLIDPFLDVEDIKNTLYFCSNTNTKLKAITALEQRKVTASDTFCIYCKSEIQNEKISKIEMINSMKERFKNSDSRILNINLEVRAKYDVNIDFHDRYLVCINNDNMIKVYSLGTSINSLGGDKFHSITEVDDTKSIIKFINELWNKLDKEECIIWKSK